MQLIGFSFAADAFYFKTPASFAISRGTT